MKTPLRVCLVTTFYPPYNFGGDGIDVEHFAKALDRRGHHVTVIHDIDAYEALSQEQHAPPAPSSIQVIGLKSRLGALSTLMTHQAGRPIVHGRRLARLFRAHPFDVVMFNNVSLVGGPGILSLGGDAVRLYLAHEHWLVCPTHVLWRHNREACTGRQCTRCVLHYRRPPQYWRHTGYLERQLSHVDAFIARSEFSRDQHRRFGFPRPMEVLPHFLPEAHSNAGSDRQDSPHVRPYVLFVGRLEKIKGLDTVIPVFAGYADADLLVAGDGTEESALRSLASSNPRVRFLGRLSAEALDRYYAHALAAVMPSVGYETGGLVLLEAMRQGTPVIARRIGPFPEIVESSGAGELFSTGPELLDALRRIQHDAGYRATLGQRGREAWQNRWSEDVILDRYFDILARAARERSAARGLPLPAWLPEAAQS